MQIKRFTEGMKGVDGCPTCAWAVEGARKLVSEGRRNVTVNVPDGRSRHIHGYGYETTQKGAEKS